MDDTRERFESLDREINFLNKNNFKLNKELIQKPYVYIDKIKAELDKEQKSIVDIIKSNNEKYINKIGNVELKVNQVL